MAKERHFGLAVLADFLEEAVAPTRMVLLKQILSKIHSQIKTQLLRLERDAGYARRENKYQLEHTCKELTRATRQNEKLAAEL